MSNNNNSTDNYLEALNNYSKALKRFAKRCERHEENHKNNMLELKTMSDSLQEEINNLTNKGD